MKTLSPLEDGPTHPGRNKRLAAIEKGWSKAKGTTPARTGTPVPPEQAEPARSGPWTNSLGMVFVPVPGVDVAFCIWETRLQDFEAFVRDTGHNARVGMKSLRDGRWNEHGDWWRDPGFVQATNYPVCGVNWNDANAFCQWLTGKERKAGLLPAEVAYRLPTDAEWSVAVGLPKEVGDSPKAKDGLLRDLYPWGGQWPPPDGAGNYAGEEARTPDVPSNWPLLEGYRDAFPRTAPVASFKPSFNGIYDLGGNVWEWCADLFTSGSKERVLRGGSWYSERQENLLAAARSRKDPESREADCGFRCVLTYGPAGGTTSKK
jgi:formylglycine-generating enzyme required for sulfatase activity